MAREIKAMEYQELQAEANSCMEKILFLAIDKKEPPNTQSPEYQRCQSVVTEFRKQFIDHMAKTLNLDDKSVQQIKSQLNKSD